RADVLEPQSFEPLSEKEYVEGNQLLESSKTLSKHDRATIYKLYRIYQTQLQTPRTRVDEHSNSPEQLDKEKDTEWDIADCVNDIYWRWKRKKRASGGVGFHGRQVTAMCVDEAQ
ncbi:unnamed protein product, partial [Amoebophrya sp. A120]